MVVPEWEYFVVSKFQRKQYIKLIRTTYQNIDCFSTPYLAKEGLNLYFWLIDYIYKLHDYSINLTHGLVADIKKPIPLSLL